jgi:hypothetical protein
MWTPTIVLELLLVWAIIFLISLLPAVWMGRFVAKKCPRTPDAILVCLICTFLMACVLASFLTLVQFESLPHVRAERKGFSIFFSIVVFGVPTFAALLIGLRRARRIFVSV